HYKLPHFTASVMLWTHFAQKRNALDFNDSALDGFYGKRNALDYNGNALDEFCIVTIMLLRFHNTMDESTIMHYP
ncbi:hypothetical protein A2U01_0077250, partial [Trifolium medium]|nr:hypothetical protein [Trifolium medium]